MVQAFFVLFCSKPSCVSHRLNLMGYTIFTERFEYELLMHDMYTSYFCRVLQETLMYRLNIVGYNIMYKNMDLLYYIYCHENLENINELLTSLAYL